MSPIGNLSPQGSIALGIFVGLLSTSVQSIGLTLQRKSHMLEDEKDHDEHRRPPFKRRRWQLGMLMFIVSNLVGSSIQITTLPLPVLSTLQASGLVFNSTCATIILGEPFTRWSFIGTILVCMGAVLIAVFGAIGEPAHNLDQLLALLQRRQFIIWMIATAIIVFGVVGSAKTTKYIRPWAKNDPGMRLFRGMSYGGVSGVLSAHSLLVAKSAVELLVRTIVDQHNEFNRWQSWIILLGLLALALSQLYYLHRGLKLCSTSILYPFVFCVYNIIAILDGLIYFHQTDRLSVLRALLITLGTVILLTGVLGLSWRLHGDQASRTSVAKSPLTPGLGFIDEDISETEAVSPAFPDEETALLNKESPYLHPDVRTPTAQDDDMLPAARLRHKGITEQEEIWQELEHDTLPPLSPYANRRVSFRTTSNPSSKRQSQVELPVIDDEPTDSTALLARSGTGRIYRDHRRRSSAPGLNIQGRNKSRRSVSEQQSSGGWWKRALWTSPRNSKGKGVSDPAHSNGGDVDHGGAGNTR